MHLQERSQKWVRGTKVFRSAHLSGGISRLRGGSAKKKFQYVGVLVTKSRFLYRSRKKPLKTRDWEIQYKVIRSGGGKEGKKKRIRSAVTREKFIWNCRKERGCRGCPGLIQRQHARIRKKKKSFEKSRKRKSEALWRLRFMARERGRE